MDVKEAAERLPRWEARTEVPLFAASVLFLACYAVLVLAQRADALLRDVALALALATWVVFAADYAIRLVLSGQGLRFPRSHWLDTLVLVLPLLRPLRMVKVYSAVQQRRARPRLSLQARVMAYASLSAVLLGFAAALAVYSSERSAPDATIRTFGDSVWWAAATLSTVGYGDVAPVTGLGRLIAVGLMACGIALLGAVTGAFSSWVLDVFTRGDENGPPGSR
ncbi:potassium channel family protein [Streptomyces sp. NBC_00344]|uniref:potassium channel family protein n=1 Tax=Streptomyces sp. NBC_00344 TaxID=2975720 RepID=UPI002E216071